MKKYAAIFGVFVASAQTLPRPAVPFDFTMANGAAAHLADYKGRIVALYLFSPN